jgi:hypothetical protein
MYYINTWKTVEPPMGTVRNCPPRGGEQTSIGGAHGSLWADCIKAIFLLCWSAA